MKVRRLHSWHVLDLADRLIVALWGDGEFDAKVRWKAPNTEKARGCRQCGLCVNGGNRTFAALGWKGRNADRAARPSNRVAGSNPHTSDSIDARDIQIPDDLRHRSTLALIRPAEPAPCFPPAQSRHPARVASRAFPLRACGRPGSTARWTIERLQKSRSKAAT